MNKVLCSILLLYLSVSYAFSQAVTYKIDDTNSTLESTFENLEKQYGLLFSYKSEDLKDLYTKGPIRSTLLPDLLTQLLKGTELEYEITDTKYVIIKAKSMPLSIYIYGQILDALSQDPLPYANVILEGTSVGVPTDSLGRFEFLHGFVQGDQLRISYIGYETQTVDYGVFLPKGYTPLALDIPEDMTPFLVIKDYMTDGINLEENGHSTDINPSKVGVLPGQAEPNVLRTAQFLPGIAAPSSKASDLYIRGGTPDQNLILWEDIPIYHSAHYFGMISAFDPYTIEEMKIYRGGFGAEYGGRVSGVIAMESGNEMSYEDKFGVGANMTHAYVYGQQRLGAQKKTAITFSVRRSYSEIGDTPTFNKINRVNQQGFIINGREVDILPDNIKIDNDIKFIDTHFKLSSQITKKDRIDIAGLYANNKFRDEIIDNNVGNGQQDSMLLNNLGLSIDYQHSWSPKWTSGVKLIGTSYNYDYNYNFIAFGNQNFKSEGLKENKIEDNQLLLTSRYKGAQNQLIEVGYHLINYDIDFKVEESGIGMNMINDGEQSTTNLHSLYAAYENPISNKIGLNLGLRASYQDISGQYFIEPRAHVAYQCLPELSLSASYGKYHQFVGQVSQFRGNESGISLPVWALSENQSIPIQKGQLYQVGLILNKNEWVADLQLYTKSISGLSSRAFDIAKLLDEIEAFTGSNRIKGVDLLVKKRINKLKTWVSYSYSKSELLFKDLSTDYFPSDYNQGHNLRASLQYQYKQFEIGLGYKISSGLPYTEGTNFQILNVPNPNLPQEFNIIYGSPNAEQLPYTKELNFTVQYHYKPKNKKWESYLSFSLTNVLNTFNVYNRSYYVDEGPITIPTLESLDKVNLLRTPNLSLRFEW